MQVCTGSSKALGTLSGDLRCPSSDSCCCSVATYALLSACLVCQGHKVQAIQPSYTDFFEESGCPDPNVTLPFPTSIQPQVQSLHVPLWALIRPNDLNEHWNFSEANTNGTLELLQPSGSPPLVLPTVTISVIPSSSSPTGLTASSSASSGTSTSAGTIAGSVIGSLALVGLMCAGGWFFWRWRRRRVIKPCKGARVDLTEPEMDGPSPRTVDLNSHAADPLKRVATFPFPYEGVVPRYHPNARHSFEPSRSDEEPTAPEFDSDPHASRRHTAPTPMLPPTAFPIMDQFDHDLASLKGVVAPPANQPNEPRPGEGKGQVHHPYIHKAPRRRAASITTFTQSSNSGSASSRRARRKSGAEDVAKGRYFHLPPSAQYLANVARYPEKVDPERPWDVRQDAGASR